jgi:hypothetical protein
MHTTIYVAIALIGLTSIHVYSQTELCSQARTAASLSASGNGCGCLLPTSCQECIDGGDQGLVQCSNGCFYCDISQTFCGMFSYLVSKATAEVFTGSTTMPITFAIYSYLWEYVQGRNGFLRLHINFFSNTCEVFVNDQQCSSCTMYSCTNGNLEPSIDCTNLEAGGLTSLDDTALNGILGPLAFPYWGCQEGTMTLSENSGKVGENVTLCSIDVSIRVSYHSLFSQVILLRSSRI